MSLTICTSEKLMCNDADAVYPLKNQGSRGGAPYSSVLLPLLPSPPPPLLQPPLLLPLPMRVVVGEIICNE